MPGLCLVKERLDVFFRDPFAQYFHGALNAQGQVFRLHIFRVDEIFVYPFLDEPGQLTTS